jgi:chaperonin GroES
LAVFWEILRTLAAGSELAPGYKATMKNKITPLGENILVKPEKQDKKTKSGIYLPDTAAEEKTQQGRVMAVGDSDKIKVKKGQKVIYREYSGTDVKIEGEDYLIVKNEDILAVVR